MMIRYLCKNITNHLTFWYYFSFYLPLKNDLYIRNVWIQNTFLRLKNKSTLIVSLQDILLELFTEKGSNTTFELSKKDLTLLKNLNIASFVSFWIKITILSMFK